MGGGKRVESGARGDGVEPRAALAPQNSRRAARCARSRSAHRAQRWCVAARSAGCQTHLRWAWPRRAQRNRVFESRALRWPLVRIARRGRAQRWPLIFYWRKAARSACLPGCGAARGAGSRLILNQVAARRAGFTGPRAALALHKRRPTKPRSGTLLLIVSSACGMAAPVLCTTYNCT